MKKTLISSGILALTLFSHPGSTSDLAMHSSLAPALKSLPVIEVRATVPATQLQLATIGDAQGPRSGNLRDAGRSAGTPPAEGLPSTPVALAAMLLIICILIGRRNGREHV